jgi:hypothetical protein
MRIPAFTRDVPKSEAELHLIFGRAALAVLILGCAGIRSLSGQTEKVVREGPGFTHHVAANGSVMSARDFRTGDVVLYDARTGQVLSSISDHDADEFAFAPTVSADGTRVAYAWLNRQFYFDLRVADTRANSASRRIVDEAASSDVTPLGWSPDNTQVLAFLTYWNRPNELVAVSASDGKRTVLKEFDGQDVSGGCYLSDRTIAYAAARTKGVSPEDVYALDLQTRASTPIATDINVGSPLICVRGGAAFIATRAGRSGVYFVAWRGGPAPKPQFITEASVQQFVGLTNDGRVYLSKAVPARQDVFLARLDGATGRAVGEPERVSTAEDASATDPSWASSDTIAYRTRRNGKPVLVRIALADRSVTSLALEPAPQGPIGWFPDGNSIAVASTYQGKAASASIDSIWVRASPC